MASLWLPCGFYAASVPNPSIVITIVSSRGFLASAEGIAVDDEMGALDEQLILMSTTLITGIEHLAQLPALESLDLGYTGVGDSGVAALGAATGLTSLNLDSCNVSDRCVRLLYFVHVLFHSRGGSLGSFALFERRRKHFQTFNGACY